MCYVDIAFDFFFYICFLFQANCTLLDLDLFVLGTLWTVFLPRKVSESSNFKNKLFQ